MAARGNETEVDLAVRSWWRIESGRGYHRYDVALTIRVVRGRARALEKTATLFRTLSASQFCNLVAARVTSVGSFSAPFAGRG